MGRVSEHGPRSEKVQLRWGPVLKHEGLLMLAWLAGRCTFTSPVIFAGMASAGLVVREVCVPVVCEGYHVEQRIQWVLNLWLLVIAVLCLYHWEKCKQGRRAKQSEDLVQDLCPSVLQKSLRAL